jgi:uncharacterized membrane protein
MAFNLVVESETPIDQRAGRIVSRAWVLLGVGLGAFVDGIVLHQILQWHHMLSATDGQPVDTIAGLQTNTLADGLFHLAALAITLIGLVWLHRSEADSARARPTQIVGAMLVGWGLFNLVEGVIDHHLLGLHHVRDDVANPAGWDIGFLVISAGIVAVGGLLRRKPGTRRR